MTELMSLSDMRRNLSPVATPVNKPLGPFLKANTFDFDRCLQRELCWILKQKQELILSVFYQRTIPAVAINLAFDEEGNDWHEVIDGKQRLSALLGFRDDEFFIPLEGKNYLMSDLPIEWQRGYAHSSSIPVLLAEDLNDKQKLSWFCFLNFAGTPQNIGYLNEMKELLQNAA